MKEIEFLPEWYRASKRREVAYRTEYVAIVGLFGVLLVWNLVTVGTVCRASAQLAQMKPVEVKARKVLQRFEGLKKQLSVMQHQAQLLEMVDSRIDVGSVLAELSYLLGPRIVLSRLELICEKFPDKKAKSSKTNPGPTVRVARVRQVSKEDLPLGDSRFRIVLRGIAAEPADIATLVCKLEESPYFFQVVLSFSRSTEVTVGPAMGGEKNLKATSGATVVLGNAAASEIQLRVSEFEVSCYLANYRTE